MKKNTFLITFLFLFFLCIGNINAQLFGGNGPINVYRGLEVVEFRAAVKNPENGNLISRSYISLKPTINTYTRDNDQGHNHYYALFVNGTNALGAITPVQMRGSHDLFKNTAFGIYLQRINRSNGTPLGTPYLYQALRNENSYYDHIGPLPGSTKEGQQAIKRANDNQSVPVLNIFFQFDYNNSIRQYQNETNGHIKFDFIFVNHQPKFLHSIVGKPIEELSEVSLTIDPNRIPGMVTAPEINEYNKNFQFANNSSIDRNVVIENIRAFDNQDGLIPKREISYTAIKYDNLGNIEETFRTEQSFHNSFNESENARYKVTYRVTDTSGLEGFLTKDFIKGRYVVITEPYRELKFEGFREAKSNEKAYFEFSTIDNLKQDAISDILIESVKITLEKKNTEGMVYKTENLIETKNTYIKIEKVNSVNGNVSPKQFENRIATNTDFEYVIAKGEKVKMLSYNINSEGSSHNEYDKYIIKVYVDENNNLPKDILDDSNLAFRFSFIKLEGSHLSELITSQQSFISKEITIEEKESLKSKFNESIPEIKIANGNKKTEFNAEENISNEELMSYVTAFDKIDGNLTSKIDITIKREESVILFDGITQSLTPGKYSINYEVVNSIGKKDNKSIEIFVNKVITNPYRILEFDKNFGFNRESDETENYYRLTTKDLVREGNVISQTEYVQFTVNLKSSDPNNEDHSIEGQFNSVMANYIEVYKIDISGKKVLLDGPIAFDKNLEREDYEIAANSLVFKTSRRYNGETYEIRVKNSNEFPIYNHLTSDNHKVDFEFKYLKLQDLDGREIISQKSLANTTVFGKTTLGLPPVINIDKNKKEEYDNEEFTWNDFISGVSATDIIDGNITDKITYTITSTENPSVSFKGNLSTTNPEMIEELNKQGKYKITYSVVNSKSVKAFGNPKFIINKKENTIGIDKFELTEVSIYPNPSSNFVNIELDKPIAELTVYDMSGRVIYSDRNINSTTVKLDVNNYTSGIYILNIKTEKESASFKIVKK